MLKMERLLGDECLNTELQMQHNQLCNQIII